MKTIKNLLAIITLGLPLVAFANCNSSEKFIPGDKLPASARDFLKTYFASEPVVSATQDGAWGDYDVILKDGTDIDFSYKGNLESVEAAHGKTLPESLLVILPAAITNYIKANYPTGNINQITIENKTWEVGITGIQADLIFDKKGNYLGMDD